MSKDVWMLGVGLGLLADELSCRGQATEPVLEPSIRAGMEWIGLIAGS